MEELHRARPVRWSVELACLLQVCHPPSTSMYSPTWKLSEPHTLGLFMEASSCRHDWLLSQSPVPVPSLEDEGWGWIPQASDNGLVFLLTSCQPEAIQEPTRSCLKGLSYQPGNSKGFRSSMSGTGGKDHKQKMLLEPLSLRKLQRLLKLWPGAGVKDQNTYFLLYHNIINSKIADPSSINRPFLNFQTVSSFPRFEQHSKEHPCMCILASGFHFSE